MNLSIFQFTKTPYLLNKKYLKDLNSSNGTFVVDSHGDLTRINKELLFENLKHLSPNSILLGKDAEIKFFFQT